MSVSCAWSNCLQFLGGLHNLVRAAGSRISAHGPIWFLDATSLTGGAGGSGGPLQLELQGGVYLSPTPIEASAP